MKADAAKGGLMRNDLHRLKFGSGRLDGYLNNVFRLFNIFVQYGLGE
jgi:hypothetical protein